MKKFLTTILLFVYALVSTGFVVSAHYCMDKLNGVQLGDASHDTCGKCGMPLKDANGCCKDDVKVYKMQIDQAFAKVQNADLSFDALAPVLTPIVSPAVLAQAKITNPLAHGPPLYERDIYLKNRVFRL